MGGAETHAVARVLATNHRAPPVSVAQTASGDDQLPLGGGTNAGVSWNVNGIRACVRHGFVDFVDWSGADIVGVQEVRARPEDIPPAARRPPGWHTAFTVAERRGYSGVGLYSKLQPVRVDTSLGVPRFDREGRFMAAQFQTAHGRFVVVNGSFPKGSGPARDNSRVGYKLANSLPSPVRRDSYHRVGATAAPRCGLLLLRP